MSETNKCFASNCERNCPKMISQILSETSKCFASRPFQTIFGSNVLWSGLVTLWRNCALSSFHNFECVYCSKKREGSLEAAAPRERERERVYTAQKIILRRVFCYDLITTTHQFISLKSCSNIQEGSSKVVLLCPVIVVFTNFFLKIITAKQF